MFISPVLRESRLVLNEVECRLDLLMFTFRDHFLLKKAGTVRRDL